MREVLRDGESMRRDGEFREGRERRRRVSRREIATTRLESTLSSESSVEIN